MRQGIMSSNLIGKIIPGSRRGSGEKDIQEVEKANTVVNFFIDPLWATEV